MSKHKLEYRDFVEAIDLDAFEEAIAFEPLEHRRGEDIGYCPDIWGMHKHGDTTGKFSINRDKRVYHCFVCGGGNLLSLAMEHQQLDEESATEWLHQFARGDTRTDAAFVDDFMDLIDKRQQKKPDRMPHFNEHVLSQFHNVDKDGGLLGEENELFEWAWSRGISEEIVVEYQLGYKGYHKKGAPLRGGEKSGEDYYGPCIVFPHFWMGQLVGWQHRWLNYGLDTPEWLPKYTNTSDFPASTTLYNYDNAIKLSDPPVVVESVPTVLFLKTIGINAVSTFGSKVVEEQLRLLRRFNHVILAPDNDAPGRKFVAGAVPYLERYTDVIVLPPVTLREGADLGDYIDTAGTVEAVYDHLKAGQEPDILGLNG
jgi:hypothetical protein